MKLTEINLVSRLNGKLDRQFNMESRCICELFWSRLASKNITKIKKCNILVYDITTKGKEEDFKSYGGVTFAIVYSDIHYYFKQRNDKKKAILLDLLKVGMNKIFESEGEDQNIINECYKECISINYLYYFFIGNRFKKSPDKNHKIGFYCEWELDYCRIYTILFDKKTEIQRKLLWGLEPHEGIVSYYLDWKWMDNKSVMLWDKRYTSDSNLNKWIIEI